MKDDVGGEGGADREREKQRGSLTSKAGRSSRNAHGLAVLQRPRLCLWWRPLELWTELFHFLMERRVRFLDAPLLPKDKILLFLVNGVDWERAAGPVRALRGATSESRGVRCAPSYRRHVKAATVNQGYFQREHQSRAVSLSLKDFLLICC